MANDIDDRSLEHLLRGVRPTRREFLLYIGAMVAAAACGEEARDGSTAVPPAPQFATTPFTLGVASGDPQPNSVILWTRLALDPLNEGGMPAIDVPVIWEVAADQDFRTVVRSGWLYATPAFAHSVHVDADGLQADRVYWYRFRIGDDWTTDVGRTRTLPARNSSPARFRFAAASCQNYKDGFYHAHAALAQEDIDLVFFAGDYIYESGQGGGVRDHNGPRLATLADYRNRYALYKTDPSLQAAHRRAPWVVTWDDHEVSNNYAGLELAESLPPEPDAATLRAAAYRAYYEHQPLRIVPPSNFVDMEIYRAFDIGDLASFNVLDTRQYRSDQACNDAPGRPCAEVRDPSRTLLGTTQKSWLKSRLQGSTALWNLVAQQVVFAPVDFGGAFVNPDQWDGYPVERQELLDFFAEVQNVVVLTGDIHAAGFAVLNQNPAMATSKVVGVEVVATSITSGGDAGSLGPLADAIKLRHPHIRHLNATKRGYSVCELRRDSMSVEFRIVSTVIEQNTELSTDARFEVAAGTLAITVPT